MTTARGPEGTVRTSMHAKNERARPGDRTSLVDAVMDLPEVQGSQRVEASVPYGDGESLDRLRQRTADPQTRVAGATTLLDANVPSGSWPAGERQPAEEPADGQPPDDDLRRAAALVFDNTERDCSRGNRPELVLVGSA